MTTGVTDNMVVRARKARTGMHDVTSDGEGIMVSDRVSAFSPIAPKIAKNASPREPSSPLSGVYATAFTNTLVIYIGLRASIRNCLPLNAIMGRNGRMKRANFTSA